MTLVNAETGEIVEYDETLEELEQVIERGLESFLDVGNAMLKIKVDRRYREAGYSTFEDYCSRRWGITRQHGNRLVVAAATVEALARDMEPIGSVLPTAESQVRPLAKLDSDEEKVEVWQEAVEEAAAEDRTPTAADVEKVVERRTESTTTTRSPTPKQQHDELISTSETTWADVTAVYPKAADVPAKDREGLRRAFIQLQTMTGAEKVKREQSFLNFIDTALASPEELAERRANAEVRPLKCPTCKRPYGGDDQ